MSQHDPFRAWGHQATRYRPDAEKVSIVGVFHKWPMWHNAGAEWMAHTLLREMVARGHEVRVYAQVSIRQPTVVHGVTVVPYQHLHQIRRLDADVMVTHLDLTRMAVAMAGDVGLPVIHLLHNDRQLQFHHVPRRYAELCVSNSQWIRESYRTIEHYAAWPMEVIHPPVEVDDYEVKFPTGEEMVTLVNLSVPKGAEVFWQLAEAMPHRRFLAVVGAYATQHYRNPLPPNVTLIANTAKIVDDVYARTKVLLMPSNYESWGRCAVEAACSRIPTVAHPTPGLVESMGTAAVWADRDDLGAWVAAIDRLCDDEAEWRRVGKAARARAEELDPRTDGSYDRFERMVVDVVHGKYAI